MAKPKKKKTLGERLEAAGKKSAKAYAAREKAAKKAAAAEPPRYRKAIVTFIDILGFKEIVKTRSATDIHEILSELADWSGGDTDYIAEEDEASIPVGLTGAIAFSDNVVRVCPIDTDEDDEGGHGALFHELLSLVHVQAKLAERGIFLRGGMTVDDIHMSARMVFGPGLVRAYELESSLAIYPRIVIDPGAIQALFENPAMRGHDDVEDDLEYIDNLVRQGEDGFYFVDYLKACRSELNNPGEGFPLKLREHAAFITEAAAKFGQLTSAKQKYLWLARYHNAVVSETPDAGDDCRIDEVALQFPSLSEPPPGVESATPESAKPKRSGARRKTSGVGKTPSRKRDK